MKTKEEILDQVNFFITPEKKQQILVAMEEYATQCQEDMAYTIKKAIEFGYQLRNNNKPINSGIDWVKEFNSLNKQD